MIKIEEDNIPTNETLELKQEAKSNKKKGQSEEEMLSFKDTPQLVRGKTIFVVINSLVNRTADLATDYCTAYDYMDLKSMKTFFSFLDCMDKCISGASETLTAVIENGINKEEK